MTGVNNAGLVLHVYGGLGTSPILFSSGVDASTATIANSNMAIFDNGSVSVGGAADAASVKFQITSTTKGFLPPRMTTTQINAISSPATGLMVYNTTENTICFYNGTTWQKVTSSAL